MPIVRWFDRFQQRHRVLGFPIGVAYKYFDDQGGYLAALITYYAVLALFPLLLLLSTVLGLVLKGNPDLQQQVLDSALSQFPVIGEDLGTPQQIGGGVSGLVIGLLLSLYGGLGVAQAAQNAMNAAWSVPRNLRPNPFKARGISVLLLLTVGLGLLATTAVSAVSSAGVFGEQLGSGTLRVLVLAADAAVNAVIFTIAFRLGTARPFRLGEVAPGAILAALVYLCLQLFGASYVGYIVQRSSATSGVFALVLGLIAFVYVTAVSVVLCVEVNVVRHGRLWPRALLTPFTDSVDLTPGDRRAYTRQATAQRLKGFEDIDVSFGPRPRDAEEDPAP